MTTTTIQTVHGLTFPIQVVKESDHSSTDGTIDSRDDEPPEACQDDDSSPAPAPDRALSSQRTNGE